jgi:hypothetical protein
MKGRLKLDGQTGLISENVRHHLSNDMAPHLSRTEGTSDNALTLLFVDFFPLGVTTHWGFVFTAL